MIRLTFGIVKLTKSELLTAIQDATMGNDYPFGTDSPANYIQIDKILIDERDEVVIEFTKKEL